jgi:hypothetical protein
MPLVLLGVKLFEIADFCLYDVNSVSIKIGISGTFLNILFQQLHFHDTSIIVRVQCTLFIIHILHEDYTNIITKSYLT